MRAGLSTIQQTLTPEASSVLNLSIAEASRRNHGQTTPLHVAATLLASPSGFLRQACIRSHPNSSHPLQCRALELCFSVALERLPTTQNMEGSGLEPPISNALMAALKRAQAHQRRGCPEQQQQPLLAVKVELEQLIISILDDPSVSRVMREASFSSPAVKAAIEQTLNSSNSHVHHQHHVAAGSVNFGGVGPRLLPIPAQLKPPPLAEPPPQSSQIANRNVYLNPRLRQGGSGYAGNSKGEELSKVLEIMSRSKKKNPILIGDCEPEALVKEFLRKIVNKEFGGDGNFKNVEVVSMDKGVLSEKNQIGARMEELGGVIESRIKNGGVILDLGDLKWLVEQPLSLGGVQQKQQVVTEMGRAAVVEMKKLLARFGGGDSGNKLWLIGTATCETYLRCQVYHSSMENDWDLQAVPIASRSPLPGMFPRLGTERISSNPVESLSPLKAIPSPLPALTSNAQRSSLCSQCSVSYEKELAKLGAIEKSFSEAMQPSLPAWLQSARTKDESQVKDSGLLLKQKTQDLQKKWRDTCLNLHPSFHQSTCSDRPGPPALSITSLYNPSLLSRSPLQPKLQLAKPLGAALQLNTNRVPSRPPELVSNDSPRSPVHTDLNLGWKVGGGDTPEKTTTEDQAKDLLGCISSEPQTKLFSNALDVDTYKKLLKGLMEKAWWQAEAATAVASAITRCRLGNGKRRGAGSRGDVWLLFTGPDRVGKKKMASVIGEQVFGVNPVVICLGRKRDDEEPDMSFRGRTSIDRIAEVIRRNPFLVIMLEDIDEADMLVRGSIKRAMERGRLTDSHGREVGLGNAIFIVTGDWSTTQPDAARDGRFIDEEKLASMASDGWQLGLIVREKTGKRRPSWLQDEEDRPLKPRRETGAGLSLDLNLTTAFVDDEKTDGSNNSSDLTIDHDDELGLVNGQFSVTSVPRDLVSNVDDAIVFKPVSSAFVRCEIRKTISAKFAMEIDENVSIEVEDDVLERILGGLWHDRSSLKEWMEKVVAPSFDQLKTRLPSADRSNTMVRLVVEPGSVDGGRRRGNAAEWLPSSILV